MSTRPNFFQKLENSLRRSKAELESKQAEVDRQVRESKELQQRLRTITADVNKYREQLKRANDQYKHNRETLQIIKQAVLEGWGHPDSQGAPTYREVVALEAAIADFPRVHGYIRARLSQAEHELQKFESEQSE